MSEVRKHRMTATPVLLADVNSKIWTIRGKQVMIDRDLAILYGVETKVLNQAVKRNIERFPEEFMFRLDYQEFANLKSQNVTTSWGGDRKIPYVFTEQGVAMLSAVLKSPTAVSVSIGIMNAFVAARKLMLQNREHEVAINELRLKMKMLEDALENNLGAVNDLSEEMRQELANIYNAIGALSIKQKQAARPLNPIGYEAIDAQRKAKNGNSTNDINK